MWIESKLHERKGKSVNNFALTLPEPHSDLAIEAHEKEIEQGLIDHLQKFLLELGKGFAFVARQYHLEVGARRFIHRSFILPF
ncbi:PDDEXK nuclease domain-containing protein [Candidatus Rhabdochlamydia porcellionis]|jgi:predicted nuclease of restriction endonuclease-like (RecB) superfamily|uniref:YhcG PDDEXK nuclease domain n=1 Tax=Candidatus Rhabdochlamydia porcellionis TaxID=225148 RepID=A0ABX8Z103_9BACT|nr:PDDEXK nuclease domain-containing protein [Candidatus Rhabdochlamydia porcellionis]QZA59113.1 YhcG PDDEXK nuclease domain [Candidatus Rhabdochlamydia porcellionis]